MHSAMRHVARSLVAALALIGLWFSVPDKAQADSPGCTAVNGFSLSFNAGDAPGPIFTPSSSFTAGDAITVTLTLGPGVVLTDFGIIPPGGVVFDITGNPNTTTTVVYTIPAATTGSFEINASGPAGSAGTLSFSCGTTSGSRVGAAQQLATNAQGCHRQRPAGDAADHRRHQARRPVELRRRQHLPDCTGPPR
jgi:hypothetical protein